ncbi:MAG: ferritin [Methanoregulaceae archaeon]|nr:ferritin [Methanoregulaceae archaeon]
MKNYLITKAIEEALNKQVNREFYSAYLYLAMSSYFESMNLGGFAHWMRVQSGEESAHAMKIFKYISERGGSAELSAIEAPKARGGSAGKVFEEVFAHEQKVTGMINALVELAIREKDHATFEMLQWFVREQVEEEKQASDILAQIRMVGDTQGHLIYIDRHVGKRE